MPNAHWWGLRKKFQQSLPGVVTDSYLASVLDMKLASARVNVLPALKVAKADQIDQIFASMAKHIYRRGIKNE
jgi:hypothetical protein